MFIKNLKTGIVQECRHKSVIAHCKSRPQEYEVTEKKPTSKATNKTEAKKEAE